MSGEKRRGPGRIVLWAFCALVAAWLFLPTLIVVPISFTGVASFQFPPPSWSTRWWSSLVTTPTWTSAALNSALIALLVALIALTIGMAAALAVTRYRSRFTGIVYLLIVAPLVVPTVVVAVSVYGVALQFRAVGTIFAFVAAHASLAVPVAFIAILASLRAYNRRMDWASASLGANQLKTVWKVTLPQIAPGLISGGLFAFMFSFDEAVVSQFLVSPRLRTLPVLMFGSVRDIIDPTVAAASTALLGLTTIILIAVFLATSLSAKRRK